ncbi:hypothetical protein H257_18281 [Aphanomyces astaci]|uniref:G-protein coupled receptors family 2 profile 2 domain-containing protein n=1 Tax=Aphanomyces astaci TaxID=112090 RepID=W4FDJ8_APHAT|nr:hypothetical protein H257_18281 [Aphanomyces astaci]ETV64916.1 hypothetical protein H257_18281 [Aphanomyces astaci]|eukprot:XP_009845613.1 hypothetical protein H257_18281 [Aphanomyces astaci]
MRTHDDALRQCAADMQTPTKVLSSVSLVLGIAATFFRMWKYRQSSIPTTSSIMTLTCAFASVTSLAMLLNSWGNDSSGGDPSSYCRVKGLLFHATATCMLWQWVFHAAALHMVLVRKMSQEHLSELLSSYVVVLVVPSLFVSVALSKNDFGLDAAMSFCWIPHGMHRLAYFYSQLVVGILIFVLVMPSVLVRIIIQVEARPLLMDAAGVLYLGLSFLVLSWGALNAVSPIRTTVYSSCALHHLLWSSSGTVVSLLALLPSLLHDNSSILTKVERHDAIHPPLPSSSSAPTSRVPSSTTTPHVYLVSSGGIPLHKSSPTIIKLVSSSSGRAPSSRFPDIHHHHYTTAAAALPPSSFPSRLPSHPYHHDLCQSACNSVCGTALSVPPDTLARRDHAAAMDAYTHMLLGYVREQLQDEGYDVSSRHMSTFLSTLERSILPTSTDIHHHQSMVVTDSKVKLNQMLEEYRRDNHASFVHGDGDENGDGDRKMGIDMDVDQRLNQAMERLHRELPSTRGMAAVDVDVKVAKSVFDQHGSSSHQGSMPPVCTNGSFAGSVDLDMLLAAAKAKYAATSSHLDDDEYDDESDVDDEEEDEDDLDAQMEAARARWRAAEERAQ